MPYGANGTRANGHIANGNRAGVVAPSKVSYKIFFPTEINSWESLKNTTVGKRLGNFFRCNKLNMLRKINPIL